MSARLIVVSYELPIEIGKSNEKITVEQKLNHLSACMALATSYEKLWIGSVNSPLVEEFKSSLVDEMTKMNYVPVFLDEIEPENRNRYFDRTIWPHFHYFTQYTDFGEDLWVFYEKVNSLFADVVCQELKENDLIWIFGYQLMILPEIIRKRVPNATIGYFLDTPFPSFEIYRTLPNRKELLLGMLGADSIGFHTVGFLEHFCSATFRLCGLNRVENKILLNKRLITVDFYPMSIDFKRCENAEDFDINDGNWTLNNLKLSGLKIILSVNYLDYIEGIPVRIKAYEKFLEDHPEYREKVVLVMIVDPVSGSPHLCTDLKQEFETITGKLNGQFSTFNWSPVVYISRSLPFNELCKMYRDADICLVTPLRAGMNLTAKEFVAAKPTSGKGVLILSEMSGAVDELREAMIVNPNDINAISACIYEALTMSVEEQQSRLRKLKKRISDYDAQEWVNSFIEKLISAAHESRSDNVISVDPSDSSNQISKSYVTSKRRLLFFDYDGTLVSFHKDPKAVAPDSVLIKALTTLCADERNCVIIISGRDRETLENWLGHIPKINLAAEHGVYTRMSGIWKSWLDEYSSLWKENVLPIVQSMSAKVPGSFVEVKSHSIAFHYRAVREHCYENQICMFLDEMKYIASNMNLHALEGNKVLEIKAADVNKGKAAMKWLVSRKDWDFTLAVGDDRTDEDTFNVLNRFGTNAYTVKVGEGPTAAHFRVRDVQEARTFVFNISDLSSVN